MKRFIRMCGESIKSLPLLALLLILATPITVTAAPINWLLCEVSMSDAAAMVAKKTGGRVLKVTEEEQGGKRVYRVKVLLPEGRVKTVFVSKETGSLGG